MAEQTKARVKKKRKKVNWRDLPKLPDGRKLFDPYSTKAKRELPGKFPMLLRRASHCLSFEEAQEILADIQRIEHIIESYKLVLKELSE